MPYVGRQNVTGEFIKLDAIPQSEMIEICLLI